MIAAATMKEARENDDGDHDNVGPPSMARTAGGGGGAKNAVDNGENEDLLIDDPSVLQAALLQLKLRVAILHDVENNGGRQRQQRRGVTIRECVDALYRTERTAALVRRRFPGAIGSAVVLDQIRAFLHRQHWTPEQVLYAQSVCPDEINHENGDLPQLLAHYMGEVFHLGGLGGIPFSGKTGFAAYSTFATKRC
jgi:hypothetical protein